MGIKDKVLDILFDDENDQENTSRESFDDNEKKNYKASSLLDTGSLFIDATSPLPKTNQNQKVDQENHNSYETKQTGDSGYQLSENISPIFGLIDSKNKKNKNYSKVKSYNDISNKSFDTASKSQTPAYTSVVISPIFGPISTKPVRKSSKPRKKVNDPFERDINDTGSFDAIINETEDQEPNINFEEVPEETTEPADTMGDTDRLVRISDRINRIKNEAANIYNDDPSLNENPIDEDGYKVETIEHISDVIHSVQKYDGKIEHPVKPQPEPQPEPEPEPEPEPKSEPEQELIQESETEPQTQEPAVDDFDDLPFFSDPIVEKQELDDDEIHGILPHEYYDEDNEYKAEESTNQPVSVDDIFEEEDETEEDKDLFGVLFGDD